MVFLNLESQLFLTRQMSGTNKGLNVEVEIQPARSTSLHPSCLPTTERDQPSISLVTNRVGRLARFFVLLAVNLALKKLTSSPHDSPLSDRLLCSHTSWLATGIVIPFCVSIHLFPLSMPSQIKECVKLQRVSGNCRQNNVLSPTRHTNYLMSRDVVNVLRH